MYPVLFRIGSFEVTSFGVMVAVAALAGLWLFRRELRQSGLPVDAADAGIVGLIGGLLGDQFT
jgi:phosphatidylglycerol:prolipoprotein diacylglycerol transferase